MFQDKKLIARKVELRSLQQGIAVLLLYVLESKGSSPGRQGFFMVVNTGDEIEGSIGGGIMEHKFTEMARERLKQDEALLSVHRQGHVKKVPKDRSGLIFSGGRAVFFYRRCGDGRTLCCPTL